jgi:hypothetical protein
MPPPFTCGLSPVASGCWSAKDESAVVVPLEAVISVTAEWCYPAQTLKWRRGCPNEACMSLALPAAGRDALAKADEQIPSTAHLLQSRLHTSQPATRQGGRPSGRLGYGPRSRCRATPTAGQGGGHTSRGQQGRGAAVHQEVINGRNLDALDELLTPRWGRPHLRQPEPRAGQVILRDDPAGLPRPAGRGPRRDRRGRAGGRPGDLHRHPPGRVRRHPRDRQVDHGQRGRLLPDAGRQAGRALGWPDMFSFLMQLGVMPGPGTPGPGTPA